MTQKSFPNRPFNKIASTLRLTAALLVLPAVPALADWPDHNTNATKWVQWPNKIGYDVLAAAAGGAAGSQPLILADDFQCFKTGPITDIHIWASWLGDTPYTNIPITLAFWMDVPAITNPPPGIPSHPGSMLWSQTFGPGQYTVRPWSSADELFWNPDPAPLGVIMGNDFQIYQYNFYPTNPFVQQGSFTAPVIYWLSMTTPAPVPFGWKTATNHVLDDAVFAHADALGNPVGNWTDLHDPKGGANPRSLDLAFALTTRSTVTNPPPPQQTNKWVQYPQQFLGYDVNATFPNIVADDFQCTNAGTITNIQIWASARGDISLTNSPCTSAVFTLAIWSDAPASSASPFSRPATLLWSETFGPGTYSASFYTNGDEQFYDPTSGALQTETLIWKYNFNPKKPYCQKGSLSSPVIYWLSVYSQTPCPFGWKTSTNHNFDDAVFGHVGTSGTTITVPDWKDLHDPLDPAANTSLDMAFLLNNGPPCDNRQQPKYTQWPDPTDTGLDVKATFQKILADDFPCRQPGFINAVTVWGSWLNDKVDPTTVFQLSLWTDVPAIPGTTNLFSHPGNLLCTSYFFPPTVAATSLPRYDYRPEITGVNEQFFDPNLGSAGLIGRDTIIWRYDFHPPRPCWFQKGGPFAPTNYWLGVSATTSDTNQFLFGWKTSTNHYQDDGVFGHITASGVPLQDWKDLHDPRSGKSLDLSFQLRSCPVVGINKDMKNLTTAAADGIRAVVPGIHEVLWHYDDSPPWPNFQVTYAGGETILQWSGPGKTVPVGTITHVGFEMCGTSIVPCPKWYLLAGSTIIGSPIQVGGHVWGAGGAVVLTSDCVPSSVIVNGGTGEWHATAVPLDMMLPGTNRNPLSTFTLPIQPTRMDPGSAMRIPLPQAPGAARYLILVLNLSDQQGNPATMDFWQFPLDIAIQPIIRSLDAMGGNVNLAWPTIPGRTYHVQSSSNLGESFFDIFTELSVDGADMNVMVPMSGPRGFYRILLEPE